MFSYKRAKVYLNASDKIIELENFTQMLIKNITKNTLLCRQQAKGSVFYFKIKL